LRDNTRSEKSGLVLGVFTHTTTEILVENQFAQANSLGSHFDGFVVGNELEGLL